MLAVLHAHTRAVSRNFALPCTFKSFNKLKIYFSMYLGPAFGGHLTGQLFSIHLPDELMDNPTTRTTYLTVDQIIGAHDEWGIVTDNHGYNIDEMEWSSIDLDPPYRDLYPEVEEHLSLHSDLQYWKFINIW